MIALLVSVLGHGDLLRVARRPGEPLLCVSMTDRKGRMACFPWIERRAVVGTLEVLHTARQQPVILKPLAWEVGRVVGWGSRALGRSVVLCLCTVSREPKGDGTPSHSCLGLRVQKGKMLELRSRCRGQNRGGWDLGGTEGPATVACASGLLTGQQRSLSRGRALTLPSLLTYLSRPPGCLARTEQVGCSIVAAHCPLQATWSSVGH